MKSQDPIFCSFCKSKTSSVLRIESLLNQIPSPFPPSFQLCVRLCIFACVGRWLYAYGNLKLSGIFVDWFFYLIQWVMVSQLNSELSYRVSLGIIHLVLGNPLFTFWGYNYRRPPCPTIFMLDSGNLNCICMASMLTSEPSCLALRPSVHFMVSLWEGLTKFSKLALNSLYSGGSVWPCDRPASASLADGITGCVWDILTTAGYNFCPLWLFFVLL